MTKVAVRPNVDLEAQIDAAYDHFLGAVSDNDRRKYWYDMTALIARRSPMKVRRVEVDMGLDQRATFEPRAGRGTNP